MKKYKVGFEVTDNYQRKIKTFLFADIVATNGTEDAWLPVPATYLIQPDMTVGYVHFDPNYKKRASVQDILKE